MARFDTTRWSLVARARDRDPDAARAALDELCRAYWRPLNDHVRRRLPHGTDAADLTQAFVLSLLERGDLAGVDRARGRFRSWLVACLDHFLAHEREKALALKRGGGNLVSLEDCADSALEDGAPGAEAAFDRAWALAVLARSRTALKAAEIAAGRADLHAALEPLLEPTGDAPSLADVALRLGRSEGSARVALHRLRQRFGRCVRAEVAETVADEKDVEAELRHLIASLGA